MLFIKNTKYLLLPLLLLLPATTQCMEIEPSVIKELKKERIKIQNLFINAYDNTRAYRIPEPEVQGCIFTYTSMQSRPDWQKALFLSYIYYGNYKPASFNPPDDRFTLDCLKTNKLLLETCKNADSESMYHIIPNWMIFDKPLLKCSALGVVAVTNYIIEQTQRKDITKQLIALGFKPIPGDEEMALLNLWYRRLPIIKKLHIFNEIESKKLLLLDIPDDVIKLISQLMIKTELLF